MPLDPGLVHGGHGLPAGDDQERPLPLADGPAPAATLLPMTAVRDRVPEAPGLPD